MGFYLTHSLAAWGGLYACMSANAWAAGTRPSWKSSDAPALSLLLFSDMANTTLQGHKQQRSYDLFLWGWNGWKQDLSLQKAERHSDDYPGRVPFVIIIILEPVFWALSLSKHWRFSSESVGRLINSKLRVAAWIKHSKKKKKKKTLTLEVL